LRQGKEEKTKTEEDPGFSRIPRFGYDWKCLEGVEENMAGEGDPLGELV